MRLQQLPDGVLRLSRMNPWDVQTLRNLPVLADFSDHEAAERRLLPSPVIEPDLTPEMAMDWVEFVVPELRDSFAANLGVVMSDLDGLQRHERDPVPAPAPAAPSASPPAIEAAEPPPEPLGVPDPAADAGGKENDTVSGTSGAVPEPQPVIDYYLLDIPAGHAEAWFRAMNQARLVLSVKYGFDSENLPDLASLLISGRLEHWFQYELFASLQARLIDMVLDPELEEESVEGESEEDDDEAEEPGGEPDPDSGSDLKTDAGPDFDSGPGPGSGIKPDKPES